MRKSITDDSPEICPKCSRIMERMPGLGIYAAVNTQGTIEDYKESEHRKKVKDPERAIKNRKKHFGPEAGDPSMKSDSKHIIKRGKTLGGQNIEIDKKEFIRAAAKDDYVVSQAAKALKKTS